VPPDASATREKLLDAATKAFAEHGVENASLLDITRKAGQRNRAALHYHFGSRDGLVRAIVERHQAVVDADRAVRLDAVGPDPSVRELVALVLEPLAAELGSPSGRDYLRIVPQLLDARTAVPPALQRTMELLEQRLANPDRLLPMLLATTSLLADRARRRGPHDAFVDDLVSMAAGMLLAD